MVNQLVSSAGATFLALFPFTNPIGIVPIFYSLTASENPRNRIRQARRVVLNAIGVLVVFFLAGHLILDFFGISLGVLKVAGGLLVARTAWDMGNNSQLSIESSVGKDISFIPMAIPIVSGPGAIGMVIALAAQNSHGSNYLGSLLGIGLLGVTLYLCLSLGEPLIRVLGKSGLRAFNQVLSFFILALAIQLITDGTAALLTELDSPVSALT
jgi:multiple antibiotic resistance protein